MPMGVIQNASRKPDQDFRCFYACEIIPSHIPVPAQGKGNIKRTAARWPHAGPTSIRNVIVMLELRHHVASQLIIQEFLEYFFMFFQYIMRYLVVCLEMSIGDPRDEFFYPTLMMDSYYIRAAGIAFGR